MNIKIPDQDCNQLRIECDKIAAETNTAITVTEPIAQSSFTLQNTVNILITGIPDQAESARVKVLVMLDKQVKGTRTLFMCADILFYVCLVTAECRYIKYSIQIASINMRTETNWTSIHFGRNSYFGLFSITIFINK